MQTIRAFIAIDLPPPAKDALGLVARVLSERVARGAVRWVRPEQMHLTLRFLGDTPLDRLSDIQQAMDAATGGHKPFEMVLEGVGYFPNRSRPRVVWVGLAAAGGGESARLLALKASLDEALSPLGWPQEDRPFHAHLTIGRVKDERALKRVDWSAEVATLPVPVTAIHLIESQLRPDGPVYTVRHTSQLQL